MNIVVWNGESLGCLALILYALLIWAVASFAVAIVPYALGLGALLLIPSASYRYYFALQKRKPGDMLGRYYVGVGGSLLLWALIAAEFSWQTWALLLSILGAPIFTVGVALGAYGCARKALPLVREIWAGLLELLRKVE
jgi:hypothetical protein